MINERKDDLNTKEKSGGKMNMDTQSNGELNSIPSFKHSIIPWYLIRENV